MKFIARILGIGKEKEALLRIIRFLRNPAKYWNETDDTKTDLANILSVIIRFYAFVKLIFLYPFANVGKNIFVFLLLLFAYQLALLLLFINSWVLNISARLTMTKSNSDAAARAYTFSRLAPDISTYYMALYPFLIKRFNFFHTFLILYAGDYIISKSLLISGMARSYPMKIYKAVICTLFIYTGILIGTIVIPVIWSIEFGSEVIVRNVDLSILESTKYDLDTSHDGSQYLINNLLESIDTSIIEKYKRLAFSDSMPSKNQMNEINILLQKINPALQSTYFDREILNVSPPLGISDPKFITSIKETHNVPGYAAIWILNIRSMLKNGEVKNALTMTSESLSFFHALGESDLGLVYSIQAMVYIDKINKIVFSNINSINSTNLLDGFYEALRTNSPESEWLINALRVEWLNYKRTLLFDKFSESTYLKDTLGVPWIPPYLMKKIFDKEETGEIHDHIWARKIYLAKDPYSNMDQIKNIPELNLSKSTLALGKNMAGRILCVVSLPNYIGYGHDAIKCQRYSQFVLESIHLRKHAISLKGDYSSFAVSKLDDVNRHITFDENSRTLSSLYVIGGDTTRLEYVVELK